MTIYPNLFAEMARFGVGIDDIADEFDKSQKTIYNWFDGTTDLSQKKCVEIRDAFFDGMSTDYLFNSEPIAPYSYESFIKA